MTLINNFPILNLTIISVIIIVSVITDLKTRKIYNIITLPAILTGLILNVIYFCLKNPSLTSAMNGLVYGGKGMLLAIGIFFILYALGWFGGGDAKLMGAIGAFMGYTFTYWCILFTLVSGGFCALFLIAGDVIGKRGKSQIIVFFRSLKNKIIYNTPIIFPNKSKSATFTYSIAIAMGFIITLIKFKNIGV